MVHHASFFNFMVAIMHGSAAATDTTSAWAQTVHRILGGSVLFLTVYGVTAAAVGREVPRARASAAPPRPGEPEA